MAAVFRPTASDGDKLVNSIAVKSITAEGILAFDGSLVNVPLIKSLPADLALFQNAFQYGIERGSNGEIVGLVTYDDDCSLPWVTRHHARVDISALSAALRLAAIDTVRVDHEQLHQLEVMGSINLKEPNRSHRNGRFSAGDIGRIRRAEQILSRSPSERGWK